MQLDSLSLSFMLAVFPVAARMDFQVADTATLWMLQLSLS